jgi:membrane protein implicated in regulation of membrane protease activity
VGAVSFFVLAKQTNKKTGGVQPRARTGHEEVALGVPRAVFFISFLSFLLLFLLSFFLLIPFQNNTSKKERRAHEGNQHTAHGTVIKVLRDAVGGIR